VKIRAADAAADTICQLADGVRAVGPFVHHRR
jgi:hypothetical protein